MIGEKRPITRGFGSRKTSTRPRKAVCEACLSLVVQVRYKEDGRWSQAVSLYSQLPQTSDTEFAKAVSELQSEVRLPFVYLYNVTTAFLLSLIYFSTF